MARLVVGYSKLDQVKGLDKILKRWAAIPALAVEACQVAVNEAADDLVQNIKAVAPISHDAHHGAPIGNLREHIHRLPPRKPASARVAADAEDEHGHGYAPNVEFGHHFGARPTGPDIKKRGKIEGDIRKYAPPEPFFFPTIRRRRGALKRLVSRAMTKAVKASK